MLIRLLILPILLTLFLASCAEKINNNDSGDLKATEVQSNFKKSSDVEPIRTNTVSDKIITASGTKNFTLLDTIEDIESKLGTPLKLKQSTDECYIDSSSSNLQLLLLRDILISINFFDSSYQTDKGFRVNDKISKLLSTYPEVEYHESTSNMGDESYYVTTKSYTTQPDEQDNALIFHVSDSDPDTISIITATNYLADHSSCDVY